MLPRRQTILIVEDDDEVAHLYRMALTDEGFRVAHVRDGLDALRYLEQRHPDLIVLDIGLPRLDGKSVAQEIRSGADTAHIPILVVTGLSGDFQDLPHECLLRKPINTGHLARQVWHHLRRPNPAAR